MFKSFSVFKYGSVIFNVIVNHLYVLLFFIPLIVALFLSSRITIKDDDFLFNISVLLFIYTVITFTFFSQTGIYSPKSLYYDVNVPYKNLYNFGLLTSIRLDVQRNIINMDEKNISIIVNNEKYNNNEYNISDIDFNNKNSNINEINDYLKNSIPSKKNIYTGLFENKNLIFILAESFNTVAINKDITPNIYRLFNEGFVFNNFYNSLYPVSTADSQYLTDISLYPSDTKHSLIASNKNYYPYSLSLLFKDRNYKTYSYHNYNYNYYERDKYYSNLGFDVYKAINKGLDIPYKSDYEMVKASMDDFIKDEKFYTYYLTYSGHAPYDMNNENVKNNIDILSKYNYSKNVKYYLSTQIELDNMIKHIFEVLETNNRLDDTVIVLLPDHVPYTLTEEELLELSNRFSDEFERYKSSMVIYNKDINKYKSSDNYCSNIDILPTLLNLYGFDYDSRLLMGRDILSNNDGFVIFGNRNYIDKNIKYSSKSELIIGDDKKDIETLRQEMYLKFKISRLMLEENYYKYLFNEE